MLHTGSSKLPHRRESQRNDFEEVYSPPATTSWEMATDATHSEESRCTEQIFLKMLSQIWLWCPEAAEKGALGSCPSTHLSRRHSHLDPRLLPASGSFNSSKQALQELG